MSVRKTNENQRKTIFFFLGPGSGAIKKKKCFRTWIHFVFLAKSVNFKLFPVQLSPAAVPDLVPALVSVQQQVAAMAVGRFQIRPSTSTPAPIPRQLSFQDELLEKCRERGLTPDRPASSEFGRLSIPV